MDAGGQRTTPFKIATLDNDFVGAALVQPADRAGTGDPPGDSGPACANGGFKTGQTAPAPGRLEATPAKVPADVIPHSRSQCEPLSLAKTLSRATGQGCDNSGESACI